MGELRAGATIAATIYNHARFLPAVLEGMKRQTYAPLEFIFVDDGSTDDSVQRLVELTADVEHLLIVTQPNGGPSNAFNRALSLSRTVYTKTLDGDDIPLPHAVSSLVAALQQHPRCRWAHGEWTAYRDFPPDLPALFAANPPGRFEVVEDQLFPSLCKAGISPSKVLAETSLLREIGFCDPDIFIQDYSLELRMAAASPLARTKAPVFLGLEALDTRLSNDRRQVLHDTTLAVHNFLGARPNLLARYGGHSAHRSAGRAWHWVQRHDGRTPFSRDWLRFVTSLLRLGDPLRIMKASCEAFGPAIRRPGPPGRPCRIVTARGNLARDMNF